MNFALMKVQVHNNEFDVSIACDIYIIMIFVLDITVVVWL